MSSSASPSWSTDQGSFASASQADSSDSVVAVSFVSPVFGQGESVCNATSGTVTIDDDVSKGRLVGTYDADAGTLTIPEDGLYSIDFSAVIDWGVAPDGATSVNDTYAVEVLLTDASDNVVAANRASYVGQAAGPGRLDDGLATSGTSVIRLSADDVLTLRVREDEAVTATGASIVASTTSSRSVRCVVSRIA